MGRLQLKYFMENSILRTELENAKSMATALRLIPGVAHACDVFDMLS